MERDWKDEILEKYPINGNTFMHYLIPLKEKQKEMIEKLLYPSDSNPFWVEEKYKLILGKVMILGYYMEEDREALNYARECYLKGKNWIK